jgi:hypothetical protein
MEIIAATISLGRQLIRQPLHALVAGRAHLRDLRHGQRTK